MTPVEGPPSQRST